MDKELEQYKDFFCQCARKHLQEIKKNLQLVEKDGKNETALAECLRHAHSLKGEGAAMKFANFAYLCHILEDIFDYSKNKYLDLRPEIIEEIHQSCLCLSKALDKIKENGQEPDNGEMIKKLKTLTGVQTDGIGPSPRDKDGKPILKTKELKN